MKEKLTELLAWIRGFKNAPSLKQRLWHIGQIIRVALTPTPLAETGQTLAGFAVVLVIVVAGAALVIQQVTLTSHPTTVHGDSAIMARTAMAVNISEEDPKARLYYSLKRGTVLAIVNMGNNDKGIPACAGSVFRITENEGKTSLIETGEAYECTAFVSSCSYWNGVIKRDRYAPIIQFPDVMDTFLDWFRIIVTPQY